MYLYWQLHFSCLLALTIGHGAGTYPLFIPLQHKALQREKLCNAMSLAPESLFGHLYQGGFFMRLFLHLNREKDNAKRYMISQKSRLQYWKRLIQLIAQIFK